MSVQVKSTIFYKSAQLIGYADDVNIMGRMIRAVSEVCEELKGRAKEVGLNIRVEKIFAAVQTRRTKRMSEILTIKGHGFEVVRRFKYLGTLINTTNDTTDKIRARILAANKAYSSLQTVFRSKQIN
jgi:sorting nexin-29